MLGSTPWRAGKKARLIWRVKLRGTRRLPRKPYSSDDEDVGSPARKRSEALHAFEKEEEVRRSRQREEAFDAAVDWAASTMMRTPVSAPARAPFVQRQLSPIASEQEFTYDSDAEREGR